MAPKGKGKGSKKGGKKPSGPGSSNLTENKLVEEVDVFGVEEDKGKNKVKGEEDRVSEVSTPVDLQRLLEGMGLPASDVEKLVQESSPGATVVPESAKPDATPSHICETTETCPNPSLPSLEAAADEEKTTLRMSERERDLEKYVQEKINECVENLREMEEIENQLQQSCGHFTTSYTYDIDSWLKRWKRSRETKLECYTCVLGSLGQRLRHMKVGDRIGGVTVLRRCMEYKESKMRLLDTTPSDVDPSQLQALHEEHLQDDVDLLEQHLSTIRRAHRFLANQLRPKAV